MRANIVVAVGIVGEQEDLDRFMALMTADFGNRCQRAAEKIFMGRVQILDLPEVENAAEDEGDTGTGGEGVPGEVREGGEDIHALGRELPSEEEEPQDESRPEQA